VQRGMVWRGAERPRVQWRGVITLINRCAYSSFRNMTRPGAVLLRTTHLYSRFREALPERTEFLSHKYERITLVDARGTWPTQATGSLFFRDVKMMSNVKQSA